MLLPLPITIQDGGSEKGWGMGSHSNGRRAGCGKLEPSFSYLFAMRMTNRMLLECVIIKQWGLHDLNSKDTGGVVPWPPLHVRSKSKSSADDYPWASLWVHFLHTVVKLCSSCSTYYVPVVTPSIIKTNFENLNWSLPNFTTTTFILFLFDTANNHDFLIWHHIVLI